MRQDYLSGKKLTLGIKFEANWNDRNGERQAGRDSQISKSLRIPEIVLNRQAASALLQIKKGGPVANRPSLLKLPRSLSH